MSARRSAARLSVSAGGPAAYVPPATFAPSEITYKGYLIEPASYCINSTAWSPRVVIAARTNDGWSRRPPLYSTTTTRFPTRSEADRCALDVARAWIDTAVERPAESGTAAQP